MKIEYFKMNGLGNNFIIVDNRQEKFDITNELIIKNSDYDVIGCDQFLVLTKSDKADIFMKIYNKDASVSGACGNATRCVGAFIMNENNLNKCLVETDDGVLKCEYSSDKKSVVVNMGKPRFKSEEIPTNIKTPQMVNLDMTGVFANEWLVDGFCVNVGNPHIVFCVNDVFNVDIENKGTIIENHRIFPEKINVEVIQIINKNKIKMRVWERGSGITSACGTGACASFCAAYELGLVENNCVVEMDGGLLKISYDDNKNIIMEGDFNFEQNGVLVD